MEVAAEDVVEDGRVEAERRRRCVVKIAPLPPRDVDAAGAITAASGAGASAAAPVAAVKVRGLDGEGGGGGTALLNASCGCIGCC